MEIYKQFNIVQIIPHIKKLIYVKSLINDVKLNIINIQDVLNIKYVKTNHIFTKELLIDSLDIGFSYKYKLKNYEIHDSGIYKINKINQYSKENFDLYIENINNVINSIKQHVSDLNLFDETYIICK